MPIQNTTKKISNLLLLLLFLNIVSWYYIVQTRRNATNTINFIDVGQGDSTLIQTDNNHQIIIDGGPDNSIINQIRHIIPINDKNIELIILTHPHDDHLDGIMELMNYYHIHHIIYTDIDNNEDKYQYFKNQMKEKKISTTIANSQLIKIDNIEIKLLYPFQSISKQSFEDENESSIALKITSPRTSILITGDLSSKIEQKIMEKYYHDLNVDILKIGHHGSKTSTSNDFLIVTSPKSAIISCGQDNSFGHPAPETLDKLTQQDIEIHRTDLEGNISLEI